MGACSRLWGAGGTTRLYDWVRKHTSWTSVVLKLGAEPAAGEPIPASRGEDALLPGRSWTKLGSWARYAESLPGLKIPLARQADPGSGTSPSPSTRWARFGGVGEPAGAGKEPTVPQPPACHWPPASRPRSRAIQRDHRAPPCPAVRWGATGHSAAGGLGEATATHAASRCNQVPSRWWPARGDRHDHRARDRRPPSTPWLRTPHPAESTGVCAAPTTPSARWLTRTAPLLGQQRGASSPADPARWALARRRCARGPRSESIRLVGHLRPG